MNKLIEIDELKLELKKTQKLYLEALNRIDKAIEYIKNDDIDVCTIRYNDIFDTKNELLEILGGTNEY